MKPLLASAFFFLVTVVYAQSPDWERVLLPLDPTVAVTGVGATQFTSYVVAYSAEPRDYSPRPAGAPPIRYRPQSETGIVQLTADPAVHVSGGRVLFVERRDSELSIQQFLTTQREGDPLPRLFHVPVARERDFRTARTAFPYIPIHYVYSGDVIRTAAAQHRLRVRVFDVDARGDASVRIRTFFNGLAHRTFTLPLTSRNGTDASYPSHGELPIDTCVPFSAHTPCISGQMAIEIEPLTPGLRYFALVTLTDNFTGDVAVFAP